MTRPRDCRNNFCNDGATTFFFRPEYDAVYISETFSLSSRYHRKFSTIGICQRHVRTILGRISSRPVKRSGFSIHSPTTTTTSPPPTFINTRCRVPFLKRGDTLVSSIHPLRHWRICLSRWRNRVGKSAKMMPPFACLRDGSVLFAVPRSHFHRVNLFFGRTQEKHERV